MRVKLCSPSVVNFKRKREDNMVWIALLLRLQHRLKFHAPQFSNKYNNCNVNETCLLQNEG